MLAELQIRQVDDSKHRYKADGHALYDQMMRSLFAHVERVGLMRHTTFAVRGNKPRTKILEAALEEVDQQFERDFGLAPHSGGSVQSAYPWESAGLQSCDYFLWALQRFYERGEARFLTAMWPQFVNVIDLDLHALAPQSESQHTGVSFNEKHPLTLASRAGVGNIGNRESEDIG